MLTASRNQTINGTLQLRTLRNGFPIYLPVEVLVAETEQLGYSIPHRDNVDSVWILPLMSRVSPFGAVLFYMGDLKGNPPPVP